MEGRNAVWYAEMKTACCLLCFMGFLFKLQTLSVIGVGMSTSGGGGGLGSKFYKHCS